MKTIRNDNRRAAAPPHAAAAAATVAAEEGEKQFRVGFCPSDRSLVAAAAVRPSVRPPARSVCSTDYKLQGIGVPFALFNVRQENATICGAFVPYLSTSIGELNSVIIRSVRLLGER